jgi:hypothetical protein
MTGLLKRRINLILWYVNFCVKDFVLCPCLFPGAYLRKIAPIASTKIAFYIYYLLIISPGIHVYVYYMVFAKLLHENYLENLF